MDLASLASFDEIFAWRSPAARLLLSRRGQIPDDELLELMLGEPRLLRRPLLVRCGRIYIGLDVLKVAG